MKQIHIGFAGSVTKDQILAVAQKMHTNAVEKAIESGADPTKLVQIQYSPYLFYDINTVDKVTALDILAIVTSDAPHQESMVVRQTRDATINNGGTVIIAPFGMVAELLRVGGVV